MVEVPSGADGQRPAEDRPTTSWLRAGSPGGESPRIRLAAGAVAVAVLVGSMYLLQRGLGPKEVERLAAGSGTSGSWFCPHGGGEGWAGKIAVANPGEKRVQVRLTTLGEDGERGEGTLGVAPRSHTYVDVPADEVAAGTHVEYFGGWIGAASVVSSAAPTAGAAARCLPVTNDVQYVPAELTRRGHTAFVVVMNPFSQAAEFEVMLRTERRTVRPSALNPFILEAGRSVALRLNDFALQSPSEDTLTVRIRTAIGRVAVGALGISREGVRGEAAVPGAQREAVLPAAEYRVPAELAIFNPGEERADLVVVSQGPEGQQLVSGEAGLSMEGGAVGTVEIDGLEAAGTLVRAANEQPVAVGLRLAGESGDVATIDGDAPEARWLVLPVTHDGVGEVLVVQNPSEEPATVRLTYLSMAGPVASAQPEEVLVPAGRTMSIPLAEAGGGRSVAAIVHARTGAVVPARVASARAGYAATLGIPIPGWVLSRP